MYNNTTYKAFMAGTAAKIVAEISNQYVAEKDIPSLLTNDKAQYDIAIASIEIAEKLAEKLEDWWQGNGDHLTVFFDPEDTLHSGIENSLADIAEKLDSVIDNLKNLADNVKVL